MVTSAVASHFGYELGMFTSPSRVKHLARARWVAMAALYRRGYSYQTIAVQLGRSDHTTVLHGLQQVTDSPELQGHLAAVEAGLRIVLGGAA